MMEGDGGGEVHKEEREAQGNGAGHDRKRRDRDEFERPRPRADDRDRRRKERGDDADAEWRDRRDGRDRRDSSQLRGHQHRGGSRSRDSRERERERGNSSYPSSSGYDNLASTDRKKKRIEEKEKQACTIFVGDLDPETTAEQLTGLFYRFGGVVSSKIKENHCYGFVRFESRESAEAAIAAGQNSDGIELLNGKQVYVSWALGSLPEWKKGIGGFVVTPGKDPLQGHRSRKGVVKPSVLAAATAAAAAKANAVLASMDRAPSVEPLNDYRGRAVVAYDDLL